MERKNRTGRPPTDPGYTGLVVLAWATLLLGASSSAPGALSAQAAVEGEYGLWVSHEAERIQVAWLTERARVGVIEVLTEEEPLFHAETGPGQAHRASFPIPDAERVTLRYGAAGGALHTTTIDLDPRERDSPGVLSGVDSLFVVGDVHGEYDTLLQLLRGANLVDREGAWTGGTRHVVFLGDLFDRGPDVTRTLWFLYRLEREAEDAGGGSHVVLGNHEIMIFTHDIRYVTAKERLLARLHGIPYPNLFDVRRSLLGRWLARRPALMQVDGVLLAHGGVTPAYAEAPVESFNDSIASYIAEDIFYAWGDTTIAFVTDTTVASRLAAMDREFILVDSTVFAWRSEIFFGDESPFWYRGYVRSDSLEVPLEQVLEMRNARIHVVAHTPVPQVQTRYGGRLVAVDLDPPAREMVLLVRSDRGGGERPRFGYEGWRYGLEGRIEPLQLPTVR